MKKKKRSFGEELIESVREAAAIHRGRREPSRVFEFSALDIKKIREEKLGKSQAEFAKMLSIKLATIRNWEQNRRRPDGPALSLLRLVSAMPNEVEKVLGGGDIVAIPAAVMRKQIDKGRHQKIKPAHKRGSLQKATL